jgi:2-dehydropantoate 2-reductase
MHDDLVGGRKMEVEEMFGPLVRKAEELNVQIPTFLGVYRLLSTLNQYLPRETQGAAL